jgi:hypothetical protein
VRTTEHAGSRRVAGALSAAERAAPARDIRLFDSKGHTAAAVSGPNWESTVMHPRRQADQRP